MRIKYELFEEVFIIDDNKIQKKKITGIIVNEINNFEYRFNYIDKANMVNYFWLGSDKIFETKEQLIETL